MNTGDSDSDVGRDELGESLAVHLVWRVTGYSQSGKQSYSQPGGRGTLLFSQWSMSSSLSVFFSSSSTSTFCTCEEGGREEGCQCDTQLAALQSNLSCKAIEIYVHCSCLLLKLKSFLSSQHPILFISFLHLEGQTGGKAGRRVINQASLSPPARLTLMAVNSARPKDPTTMKVRNGSPNFRNLLFFTYVNTLDMTAETTSDPAQRLHNC